MLNDFILNIIDTFNILYLWIILTKRETYIFKLILSIVIISILITVTDQLGLNFIATYIIDIITIIMDNLLIMSATLSILIISQVFTYLYVVKVIKEKEALKVSTVTKMFF